MANIIKTLPWVLILYGFWSGYNIFNEKKFERDSLEEEVLSAQRKLDKLKKAKKDIEFYYSDIEASKEKIRKISKEFEFVQKKLPEKQDNKENFDFFKKIAKKVLIKKIDFSLGKTKKKDNYIERSYTVNANGTYLQFLLFFELLYKTERLFEVKNILFRTDEVQNKGRYQVVEGQFDINTYVYLSSRKTNDNKSDKKKVK